MADYTVMFRVSFQAAALAIDILQKARRTAEEMYISDEKPIARVLPLGDEIEHEDGDHF